jgi:hypothetical protein
MDERSTLTFLMRLLGASEVNQQARQTAGAVKDVGDQTRRAGEHAGSGRGWNIFKRNLSETERKAHAARLSVGGLVKGFGAFGVGYGALSGAHQAVDVTTNLGEQALKLNKIQGLSLRQGADLAAVAHVRGLATNRLAQSTGILGRNVHQAIDQWDKHTVAVVNAADVENKLAKLRETTNRRLLTLGAGAAADVKRQIMLGDYHVKRQQIIDQAREKAQQKAAQGAGTAADAFKALGITQDELRQAQGNMFPLLLKINDAFNQMPGGVEKTRLALQIFGRGGIQGILPLFREGPLGLRSSLKLADQTIGEFFGHGIRNTEDLLVAQQKAKFATLGLQLAMGQLLLPVIAKASSGWANLVSSVHKGAGPWGIIKTVVGGASRVLGTAVGWFSRSKTAADLLGVALVVLGAAWGVEKVINFGVAVSKLRVLSPIITLLGRMTTGLYGAAGGEAAVTAGALRMAVPILAAAYAAKKLNDEISHLLHIPRSPIHRGSTSPTDRVRDPSGGAFNDIINNRNPLNPRQPLYKIIPGLAAGGVVTGVGSWVTGEHGPELNTMAGGRVHVQPLSSGGGGAAGSPLGGLGDLATAVRDAVVEALKDMRGVVNLDGKELAESNARWQLVSTGRH